MWQTIHGGSKRREIDGSPTDNQQTDMLVSPCARWVAVGLTAVVAVNAAFRRCCWMLVGRPIQPVNPVRPGPSHLIPNRPLWNTAPSKVGSKPSTSTHSLRCIA